MNDKEKERLNYLYQRMEELSETMENIVRTPKPTLGGEQYLTDKEISKLLKISRRSLQDYRTEGKIPFYRLGGKVLYRATDIERFLENHYENKNIRKRFTDI